MEKQRGSRVGGASARLADAAHSFRDRWRTVCQDLDLFQAWARYARSPSAGSEDVGTRAGKNELQVLLHKHLPRPVAEVLPFVGLINQGLTCYLNALLQCLFVTPEFRDKVQEPAQFSRLQQALEQIFRGLEERRGPVQTRALTACLGLGYGQQDVAEVFLLLLDQLGRDDVQEVFESEVEKVIRCAVCGSEDHIPPGGRTRLLPLASHAQLCGLDRDGQAPREPAGHAQDTGALSFPLIQSFDDDDNLFFCECCNRKTPASEEKRFLRLPKVLVLQVSELTFENGKFHKTPASINVSQVLELPSAPQAPATSLSSGPGGARLSAAPERKRYQLYAMCSHVGDYRGGHYTALVQPPGQEQWYHFNDQWVDCVGPFPLRGTHRSGVPYLLLYRCQDGGDRQEDEPEDRAPETGAEDTAVPERTGPPSEGQAPRRSSAAAFPEEGDMASPALKRQGAEADIGRPAEEAEDQDPDGPEETLGTEPAAEPQGDPAELLGGRGPCPALPSAEPGPPEKASRERGPDPGAQESTAGAEAAQDPGVSAPEHGGLAAQGATDPQAGATASPPAHPCDQPSHCGQSTAQPSLLSPSARKDSWGLMPDKGEQEGPSEATDNPDPRAPSPGVEEMTPQTETACTPQVAPSQEPPAGPLDQFSICGQSSDQRCLAGPTLKDTRRQGAEADIGRPAEEAEDQDPDGPEETLGAEPAAEPQGDPAELLGGRGPCPALPSAEPGPPEKASRERGPDPGAQESTAGAEAAQDPGVSAPEHGGLAAQGATDPQAGATASPPAHPCDQPSHCGQSTAQPSLLSPSARKDSWGLMPDKGEQEGPSEATDNPDPRAPSPGVEEMTPQTETACTPQVAPSQEPPAGPLDQFSICGQSSDQRCLAGPTLKDTRRQGAEADIGRPAEEAEDQDPDGPEETLGAEPAAEPQGDPAELLGGRGPCPALPSAEPGPPEKASRERGPDPGVQESTAGPEAAQDPGVSVPEHGGLAAQAATDPQAGATASHPAHPCDQPSHCGQSTAQPSLLSPSARKDSWGLTPDKGEQEGPSEATDNPDPRAPSPGVEEMAPQTEAACTPQVAPSQEPPAGPLDQFSICGQSSDQRCLAGPTLKDAQEAEPGPGNQAETAEGEDLRAPGQPPEVGRKALETDSAGPEGRPRERSPPAGMEELSSHTVGAAQPSAASGPPETDRRERGPDPGAQESTAGAEAAQDPGVSVPEHGGLAAQAATDPQAGATASHPAHPCDQPSHCGQSTAQPSLLSPSARKDSWGLMPDKGEQEGPSEATDNPDPRAPSPGVEEMTPQTEAACTPQVAPSQEPPAGPLDQFSICGQSSDQRCLAEPTLKDTQGPEADIGRPAEEAEDQDPDGPEETLGAEPAAEPQGDPAELLGGRGPCPALPSAEPGPPEKASLPSLNGSSGHSLQLSPGMESPWPEPAPHLAAPAPAAGTSTS